MVLLLLALLWASPAVGDTLLQSPLILDATPCAVSQSFDKGTANRIAWTLLAAKSRIRIAMYAFTNPSLADVLIMTHARGIDVQMKTDYLQSSGKSQKEQIERLRKEGVPVEVSKLKRTQHNKFAVIDGLLVITGSHNWTLSAENKNVENAVFIQCAAVAEEFEERWKGIK